MKLKKKENIIVFGGSGFIGTKLINALDGNIKIVSRKNNLNFPTINYDLEKNSVPKSIFKNIDKVFYLAGIAHDTNNIINKNSYYLVNTEAVYNLACLASISGVKSFIYVSSVKAGKTNKKKNNPFSNKKEDVYGNSKREAELKLLKMCKKTNMHISIIRPALVYGPGVKGNLELMISAIKKGFFPPVPETNNKRSMIHVDDLVRAILLITRKKEAHGKILIATDDKSYSTREIYEILCKTTGKKIFPISIPKFFFIFLTFLHPNLKYKINKLLGNEFYSSHKLKLLGFKAEKTLESIYETDF